MELQDIIGAINGNRVRITDHADEEADADHLSIEEIFFSVRNGEIIENYPKDKPYPSCLVLGKTEKGDHIHSVWAYNAKSRWTVLITAYRPAPDRWINWRERRKKS